MHFSSISKTLAVYFLIVGNNPGWPAPGHASAVLQSPAKSLADHAAHNQNVVLNLSEFFVKADLISIAIALRFLLSETSGNIIFCAFVFWVGKYLSGGPGFHQFPCPVARHHEKGRHVGHPRRCCILCRNDNNVYCSASVRIKVLTGAWRQGRAHCMVHHLKLLPVLRRAPGDAHSLLLPPDNPIAG